MGTIFWQKEMEVNQDRKSESSKNKKEVQRLFDSFNYDDM